MAKSLEEAFAFSPSILIHREAGDGLAGPITDRIWGVLISPIWHIS